MLESDPVPGVKEGKVKVNPTGYDIAVIGGGIIGLATARQLVLDHPDRRIGVLEKEAEVATHQTGHNSGVIHAGIYYAPGSQKANFCAIGSKMLRKYCDERGIPYDMCGKVIVATDETEVPLLEELHRRGTANGAEGLEIVERERLLELEPHVAGLRAIVSPNTGIIDFSAVSQAYASDLTEAGGHLLKNTKVQSIARRDRKIYLETTAGEVSASKVINCAGLHADRIAGMMGVDIGVRIIPFRGEYFSLTPERASLVRGLIYPVPDPDLPFLGVHFTRRIGGSVEAGPNAVLAFDREGYRKTSFSIRDALGLAAYPGFWWMSASHWRTGLHETYRSRVKSAFVKSLRKLVPEIESSDLHEPGAGVRAQAVDRRGRLLQDFSIAQSDDAIHVLNAPSPGATSSLAIGQHIAGIAGESFGLGT